MRNLFYLALLVTGFVQVAASCSRSGEPDQQPRTLTQARQIALDLFKHLDGFTLEKQAEESLAGRPAVRMDALWTHDGEKRRGVIYIIDQPSLFNEIHYTAPIEQEVFDPGFAVFQKLLKTLKTVSDASTLTVNEQGDEKVMISPDLQLEIHYPSSWVYSLDDVNRALVFSGPHGEPTWMTTINFSVINKWEKTK
jgi:hypothetical protein